VKINATILATLLLIKAFPVSAELPPHPAVSDYLIFAEQENPALGSALYSWQADREKTGYAGALPDPKIYFAYFVQPVETRVGPQQQRFGLSQAIPWFGTLGARKDMAIEQAKASEQRYQAEKRKLFYEIKAAYYALYFLGRRISITRENLHLLELWEAVVRSQYRAALTGHHNLSLIQVELGKLEDRLLTLENKLGPAVTRLRTAVNLPDSFEPPIPQALQIDEQSLNADSIFSLVRNNNPNLKSTLHLINKEKAGHRLAGKLNRPGFTIGLDYIQTGEAGFPNVPDSGKDPWTIGVGMSLPIWFGANKARTREAAARQQQAQHNFEAARNELKAVSETIVFEHEDALRRLRLYRDGLIPIAEQALETGFQAYQVGEADFLSIMDTQRQLLEFQLQLERSRTDLAINRAAIDMLAGR
jgi:outer membrane protein TolC